MVHEDLRPRDRRARQKLHAAWISESNKPGVPLASGIPHTAPMKSTGTLSRFEAIGCRLPHAFLRMAGILWTHSEHYVVSDEWFPMERIEPFGVVDFGLGDIT